MLSVSVQEGEGEVANFITRYQLEYPFLLDRTGQVSVAYEVVSTPTTYFIAPDGQVVDTLVGVVSADWLESNIRKYVNA